MDFEIHVDRIEEWYRDSTKEWCVMVVATTDHCSLVLNYSAKKLNKARKSMLKNLPHDLLELEVYYRMKNHEFDDFFERH